MPAVADEPVTTEHAHEYVRLVSGGAAAGGDTMRQARRNVAERFAGSAGEDSAIEAAGGGPADPLADAGAVANTLRRAASGAASAARSGGGGLRSLGSSVSSPGGTAQTLTKLIWAAALGLIVLEVAAEATGQQWSFKLPAAGSLTKQPYQPLYAGQSVGSTTAGAMPGIFGSVPSSTLTQRALASPTPQGGFLP